MTTTPEHIKFLKEAAQDYVDEMGEPQDLYLYIDMINKPETRDKQLWPSFIDFLYEDEKRAYEDWCADQKLLTKKS